ncbi:MAG: hypothetical protein ACNI25_10205 [Halarcobacter sp.]
MDNDIKKYLKILKKTEKSIKKLPIKELDHDVKQLKKAFDIAYDNEVFALYKYESTIQDKLKFLLFCKLTKYSGTLSFLAIQILAANSIMNKNNFSKRKFYFNKKCGIAINHLRVNKTIISAKKCKNGYKLNGVLTWASGYKIFDKLLIGFHFENKEYEVLTDFKVTKKFKIAQAPETLVGYSLNTINVKLEDFFVKEENIVSSNSIGNYTKNKSLSKTVHYALYGIGLGAVKNIENKKLKSSSKSRLKKIKNKFLNSNNGEELDKLRIELFNLIQDVITTGMILNGGSSILLEKNLQRYYRELIMFNSNGLNTKIKTLFLESFLNKYMP